jgi:hypothetical protein
MFEVCESIADGRAKLEVHPLSIGGKEDPVRLVIRAIRAFMHSPRVGVDIIRGLRAHPLALIRKQGLGVQPRLGFSDRAIAKLFNANLGFRSLAKENGIDPELLISTLGGEPCVPLSRGRQPGPHRRFSLEQTT